MAYGFGRSPEFEPRDWELDAVGQRLLEIRGMESLKLTDPT